MKRVCLIVLDGVGAGALPDASQYGDEGANTLRHVIEKTGVQLPNMARIGLGQIESTGYAPNSLAKGGYGKCQEQSPGKDTTTGHWEMAGIRLDKPFPTFPNGFPVEEVIHPFEKAISRKVLGNYASSGTVILDKLGEEHMKTGYPIVYTSADSVFQIACHEDIIPIDDLYAMCETARGLLTGDYMVGRVIARPFTGTPGAFTRTPRRRDFSVPPTGTTILDVLKENGYDSIGIGKIEDIFANRGLTDSNHAAGNPACLDVLIEYMKKPFNGLVFTNLVDYDMVYGHRNDVEGFAAALKYFDDQLAVIQSLMHEEDLLIITADHGCDPTFPGTDHTREYPPLLCWHKGMNGLVDLGIRNSMSDIGASIADYFSLSQRFNAASFINELYIK